MSATHPNNEIPKPPTNVKPSPLDDLKPGSVSTHVELPNDFGARADDTTERQYASRSALNQDPGRLQTRSNDEGGGVRQAGVGTSGQGAGAGSGGDIDPDIIGVGTHGRSIAASFPEARERDARGPDRTGGDASAFASGKPAKRENQDRTSVGVSNDIPRGDTVSYDRDREPGTLDAAGADGIRTTDGEDPYEDAAVGEISRGESMGPSDDSSSSAKP